MASEEEKKRRQTAAAATEAGESVSESLRALGETYQKSSAYTGNRKLYDSPRAKVSAKTEAFKGGEVHDPYTGERLVLRKQEAKVQYGEHWQEHLAEMRQTVTKISASPRERSITPSAAVRTKNLSMMRHIWRTKASASTRRGRLTHAATAKRHGSISTRKYAATKYKMLRARFTVQEHRPRFRQAV